MNDEIPEAREAAFEINGFITAIRCDSSVSSPKTKEIIQSACLAYAERLTADLRKAHAAQLWELTEKLADEQKRRAQTVTDFKNLAETLRLTEAKLADAEREITDADAEWNRSDAHESWETCAYRMLSFSRKVCAKLKESEDAHEFTATAYTITKSDRDTAIARAEAAENALRKINVIRNSIVAHQSCNFSEHVYPLVAALNEAGIEGMSYPDALAYFGPTTERAAKAEAERDDLRREVEALKANNNPPQ